MLEDETSVSGVKNTHTRSYSTQQIGIEPDAEEGQLSQPLFDGDDMVDLRSSAADVQAGDMIEVTSTSSRLQILAVCLGNFNGFQHYYTNTGKWFTTRGIKSLFVVKNFVSKSVVQRVVESLPSTTGRPELLDTLQDLKAGPSREVGAHLIKQMNSFQNESRLVYQSSAGKLDNAFAQLAGGSERTMTLIDIANALLHPGLRVRGKFAPAAMYAVHTALMGTDIGIRPASQMNHTKTYLFEISSEEDFKLIQKTGDRLQRFLKTRAMVTQKKRDADSMLEDSEFGMFILKARKAIDDSRASRGWSPHGMLKTSEEPVSPILPGWMKDDLQIIKFMHMWAAAQKFGPVSRHHWTGAAILRVLGRYEDVEYLSESVGWTFLQEIGWVKPWEIQARYQLRLPGVELERGGGVQPVEVGNAKLQDDVFEGVRKDFDMKCFCIDSESATDIDDGVSIEPAEKSGEYWIHVHVADPASRVRPDSPWAEQAAALSQTTYLYGHFARMFGDDVIRNSFSLANDKPCLTFSGRVDESGKLLEYKVTPATLRDVTYISPDVVSDICGEKPLEADIPQTTFTVGEHSKPTYPVNRDMAKRTDLSSTDVDSLKLLSRLATNLHSRRLQKGAVPIYQPRPAAEVSFSSVQVEQTPDGFMRCAGDPSIRISYGGNQGSPLVSSIMQLAGEVAGRWCQERGIPIPYRVQPRAAENAELLKDFTEKIFYPKLHAGEKPGPDDWRTFLLLSGGTDISAVPAPNFAMGIDVYTKSTSPLRRYADLLVHWQIHAALLHSEQTNTSLVGNKDDSFLPFPKATLEEEIFPLLRIRERHARLLDNNYGNGEWMLQALVRAWKFGEGEKKLPETFRFSVSQVVPKRLVRGTLDWFDRPAVLAAGGMEGAVVEGRKMTMADVRVGDVLEVGLEDVNVYEKQIFVKALGRAEA